MVEYLFSIGIYGGEMEGIFSGEQIEVEQQIRT